MIKMSPHRRDTPFKTKKGGLSVLYMVYQVSAGFLSGLQQLLHLLQVESNLLRTPHCNCHRNSNKISPEIMKQQIITITLMI